MINLPNFEIIELIYENADVIIYRAIRIKNKQAVILKLLNINYLNTKQLTSYQQEYQITKNLNLDGVIKIYSIEEYKNKIIIVSEDIGGKSLKQFIGKKLLTIKEFLIFAIQITNSLHHIHAHNIIHKDINPNNIIINPTTRIIKITDFSIASRLAHENLSLQNPEQLEGTLAYISPEQTGRMNRSLDYRTDLYSLGVTFYELLTRKLPFESNDALELVHCHIAKIPISVCEVKPNIPQIISDIVTKLMAKNIEDRYQSASGVKSDLEKCFDKFEITNNLQHFTFKLAQDDFSSKLQIPQKLYGRTNQINTLLQAFERITQGACEMMLITGYAGVGKTVLVHEVYKPITEKHGYFASGKFDQFHRNIPYSAISQAFNEFCHYLLTESAEKLKKWREIILAAVAPNTQILIEIIPQLSLIVGQQEPVVKVGSQEAQNRLNLVFQNFLKAICQAEHPLILFIDDLQWADFASLNLLKNLMLEPKIKYFFIIGAYRSNEMSANHPLMINLESLKPRATINTIELLNLSQEKVNDLIADVLHDKPKNTQVLANLIYQKTHGNAFFVNEFLTDLYFKKLLTFQPEKRKWQWSLAEISTKEISNNVVDFMSKKITRLPDDTVNVLKLAACIGNQFDLKTLSIISEMEIKTILTQIWIAVEEELLVTLSQKSSSFLSFFQSKSPNDVTQNTILQNSAHNWNKITFKFQHDRIQQAAHSLISESEIAKINWQIGHLLLKTTTDVTLNRHIFDIVNYLNLGIAEIKNDVDRQQIIELNLLAVKKAKSSTAFEAALKYARAATSLLNQDAWSSDYAFSFELFKEQAEVEYLTGHHKIAEEIIDQLLEQAQSLIDKVEAFVLLKNLQATTGKNYAKALKIGLQILQTAELNFPEQEAEEQQVIAEKLSKIQANHYHNNLAKVIDLTIMSDKTAKVKMKLYMEFWEIAFYNGRPNLMLLCGLNLIDLSWQYGNSNESSFGYLLYGVFLTEQENYPAGYDFGSLALQVVDKFNDVAMLPKVRNLFCNYINYHRQPFSSNAEFYEQNIQKCRETGEIVFGVWAAVFLIWSHLLKGTALEEVYQLSENYLSFVKNTNDEKMLKVFQMLRLVIANLQGKSSNKYQLKNSEVNVEKFLSYWQRNNFLPGGTWYAVLMGQILYIHGDYRQAITIMKRHAKNLTPGITMFPFTQYYFYYSLNIAAYYEQANSAEKIEFLQQLAENVEKFKLWADNCPDNFEIRYLLVNAEYHRVKGVELVAMELYDQAIKAAKKYGLVQLIALANEITAQFWLKKHKFNFAQIYLTEAYTAYKQWGAIVKVQDLTQQYPQIVTKLEDFIDKSPPALEKTIHSLKTRSGHQSVNMLDLNSIIQASQILSEEIVLSELLKKMMGLVIKNAGAEKGFLLLPKQDKWLIEAEIYANNPNIKVLHSAPIKNNLNISETIICYVINTQEYVVLDHACVTGLFRHNHYIQQHQTKSVLCMPLLHQSKISGILYLENNWTIGAFTPKRLEILQLLSAQMAISIKNALFYEQQQQIHQAEKARTAAESANHAKSEFLATMSHELRTPLNGILGYAQILQYDDNLTTKQKNGLITIQNSGDYLLTLINDVLDLSKIEAGKLELVFNNFNLSAFLQEIIRSFQLSAKQKAINFIYEPLSALPETIHADEKRLQQILLNLLSNAIKFTHQGQVILAVNYQPANSSNNGKLCFQIEDTGIGIANSDQNKIFQAFEQAGTESKVIEGTGLGLPITKKLIEMMKGEIQLHSQLKKGSTFKFNVQVEEVAEIIKPNHSKPLQVIGFEGELAHILVADDKWQNRELLANFLEPLGFEVQLAKNGVDAFEKVMANPPAAILLDSIMPLMGGIEFIYKLRSELQYQQIPIIVISANVFSSHQQDCLDAGCQAFLQKPINFKELLVTLAIYLPIKWIHKPIKIQLETELVKELSLIPASAMQIAELLNIAKRGDVAGIIDYAQNLLKQEPQLKPFLQHTIQLTESMQLKKLRNWLNQF